MVAPVSRSDGADVGGQRQRPAASAKERRSWGWVSNVAALCCWPSSQNSAVHDDAAQVVPWPPPMNLVAGRSCASSRPTFDVGYDTRIELPDHLAVVLEFAAIGDVLIGEALLAGASGGHRLAA